MGKQICESLLQRASGALADTVGSIKAGRSVTDRSVQECATLTVKLLTEFNETMVYHGLVRREPELVARSQWINNRLAELRIPV